MIVQNGNQEEKLLSLSQYSTAHNFEWFTESAFIPVSAPMEVSVGLCIISFNPIYAKHEHITVQMCDKKFIFKHLFFTTVGVLWILRVRHKLRLDKSL